MSRFMVVLLADGEQAVVNVEHVATVLEDERSSKRCILRLSDGSRLHVDAPLLTIAGVLDAH